MQSGGNGESEQQFIKDVAELSHHPARWLHTQSRMDRRLTFWTSKAGVCGYSSWWQPAVRNFCYGGVSSLLSCRQLYGPRALEKDRASSHRIFPCTGPATDFSYASVSSNVQYAGRPARAACQINPTWGKDILGNVATTLALYTPILAAAPKDGVADRARSGLRAGRASSARPTQAGGPHRHAHRRVPAWWRLCPGSAGA